MKLQLNRSPMTFLRKRLLIIEKNGDIKSMLKLLLTSSDKYVLLKDYESFEEVKDLIGKLIPSVIILGLDLEGMDGIAASKWLSDFYPRIKVIMVTPHESPELIYESLQAGASGFIHSKASYQEVMKSLEEIYRDEAPMNGRIARVLIEHLRTNPNSPLTRKEKELMTMLSFGKSIVDISVSLDISKKTIHRHLANIYDKLQVNSRADAIQKAISEKLI